MIKKTTLLVLVAALASKPAFLPAAPPDAHKVAAPIPKETLVSTAVAPTALVSATQVSAAQVSAAQVSGEVKPPVRKNDRADIYLNFENATLASVVDYLAEQRKINFIPHKDLKNKKVSLTTRQPLTLARAWNVLLTLLEMNGFSIIEVDDLYRIVPNAGNQREPLPFYSSNQGTEPEDLPDSDQVIRYIYTLKNITTGTAQRILKDLLGANKIRTQEELTTCIITDKSYNIKSAMKIIKELDTGGMRESIKIIKLSHADATEVADLFSKHIMERKETGKKPIRFFGPTQKKEITYFSNTTKIIPEVRRNSLILLGLNHNIDRIIEFIHKYIDIPMDAAQSRIHIKELKYTEAITLKPILQRITRPPQAKKKGAVVGEFKYFEDVVIQAERSKVGKEDRGSGNRLIIACNKDDWRRLEKLINKLDKPQPQIALEIMIVDIEGSKVRELAAQIRQKTGKTLGHGLHGLATHITDIKNIQHPQPNLIDAAKGGPGTTSITFGKAGDIWAVIKTVLASTQSNIITQPFLVTTNNIPAVFKTSIKKLLDGKITRLGSGSSTRAVDEVEAMTKVTITPRINLDGIIDLQIRIELSEFLAGGAEADQPDRTTRDVISRLSMATGEVLVLGGLTKDKVTVNRRKTPILSDIPFLGNLFKGKSKTIAKTNIYIFIRPSIIKPRFDGSPDQYTQLKLDYAKYQIFSAEELHKTKDPIQRWFFKPEKQSVKQRLEDMKKGVFRPLDNYIEGRTQPRSVRIERDPYYRTEEELAKMEAKTSWKELGEFSKKRAYEKKKNKPTEKLTLLPSLRKRIRKQRAS